MELVLRTYDDIADLEQLRADWDQLLSDYLPATTFSTWEWLSAWWSCFGSNRQLLVLALFDSEQLAGLAPLSISVEKIAGVPLRVLRLMGDGSFDSDNLDLPVREGYGHIFGEMMLQFLRQHKNKWDVCRFDTLPPNSEIIPFLRKLLVNSSAWTYFESSSRASAIDLPKTWDEFLQLLSSEDRKNLQRYARRLQSRYDVRVYRCEREDAVQRSLSELFRLHQMRWESVGEPGTFSCSERRDFYSLLSRQLLARGWLELWVLELDSEVSAVQFAFRYRNRVFQLQEGYDCRKTSDRLGFVLRGLVLKALIAENIRIYDFLGGEDAYKKRWAAREKEYSQLCFARKRSVGALLLQADRWSKNGKEKLRRTLPPAIWSLLHRANSHLLKRPVPSAHGLSETEQNQSVETPV